MKKSPIAAASALLVVTALLSGLTSSVAGASGIGSQPADASPGTEIPGTDCPAFPADDVWNTNISGLPVNPNSATWLASMDSSTTNLHPDFGPSGDPTNPYGIPYTVVSPSHPLVNIAFDYADESDPGPYPFGADTPIEGGAGATGDRHAIMVNPQSCTLYELWDADYKATGSTAGSGAIWDLNSDALRTAGWTSADAAGLPVLPGLANYDELSAGVMDHAIRFTASCTQQSYLWPARHEAGQANSNCPPMGARFRLNASFSLPASSCDALCQAVLTTMKTYGLILADNGSNWFFQGVADTRWSSTDVDQLKQIPASAFQAVDESCLTVDPDTGQALQPGTSAYAESCPGELEFTSSAIATTDAGSPLNFTVTTAGSPTPTISASGALPAGVTFTDHGDGTASLTGVPGTAAAGSYSLTLTAHNGTDPDATQDITVNVAGTPTITSISPAQGPSGGGTSITIHGSGFVGPTSVTIGGTVVPDEAVTSPTVITATTPAGAVGPADVSVTAAGGTATDTGAFTYLAVACDPPTFTSGDAATAQSLTLFNFPVSTCSTSVPTIKAAHLPPGLHLVNNHDGTATITGTPSAVDGGAYPATLTVSVTGQPVGTQTFTVSVDNTPRFRSKGKATVVTGQPFTYPVTTEYGYPYPALTATPSLPARITLTDNGNGTGVLSGTPAPGTGGLYLIYLTATNGIGNPVTQSFNLLVNQPPVISAANTDSITAGVAMTPLTVSATGYPTPTLTATGLPSGVRLANGIISGTTRATATGTYDATITARSKAGTSTHPLTLIVGS